MDIGYGGIVNAYNRPSMYSSGTTLGSQFDLDIV